MTDSLLIRQEKTMQIAVPDLFSSIMLQYTKPYI